MVACAEASIVPPTSNKMEATRNEMATYSRRLIIGCFIVFSPVFDVAVGRYLEVPE
jgi:hypothetical protein